MLLLIGLIVFCQVLLLVYYFRSRSQSEGDKKFDRSEKQWNLLHDAIKKSQAIQAQAELEAIKETAESGQRIERFEKEVESDLQLSAAEVLELIKSETAKAGEEYKKSLAKDNEEIRKLRDEETKKVVDEGREQLQKNLHQVTDGFAKELAAYKTEREKLIDKNAEELILRAAEIYLSKKLDKKEHMQLVFESLEKAKAEKIFT